MVATRAWPGEARACATGTGKAAARAPRRGGRRWQWQLGGRPPPGGKVEPPGGSDGCGVGGDCGWGGRNPSPLIPCRNMKYWIY
jgi:hypothetical protein